MASIKARKKNSSILFINRVNTSKAGATGRVLSELTNHLAGQNWEVSILSAAADPKTEKPSGKKITRHYIKHKDNCRTASGAFWANLKFFFKALRLPKYDIIVTMTDPAMLVTCGNLLSGIKGAKHIHWSQDIYPDLLPVFGIMDENNAKYKALKKKARRELKKTSRIIAIGRCMDRYFRNSGIDQRLIRVIPNWANVSLFKKQPPSKDKPTNKFRVLYAGRLGRAHDAKAILSAMIALNKSNPEIEFVFSGMSTGHAYLKKQTETLKLKNARFLGFQPETKLRKLLELGDIHLVTMRDEAEGLVVPSKFYGSIAVKRPVIFVGPETSEVASVIKDYKCGLVVNPDVKKNDLAQAILKYRNDPDLWFESEKGMKEALDLYHPKNSFEAWDMILQEVLEEW